MKNRKVFLAFTLSLMLSAGTVLTSCQKEAAEQTADTEHDAAVTTEAVPEEEDADDYIPPVYVECANEEIHNGKLILVNREYGYDDSFNANLVNIYANKSDNYTVDGSTMELDRDMLNAINTMLDDFAAKTGITNVIANSGYRSFEEQKQMYDDDLEATGLTESELVAPPGHSEHHTGLAMDFAVASGDGYPALKNEGEYKWIYDNAHNYGMFLRYTSQNRHITGYMAESWHFRYVGPVHASLIWKMGVAYEEYIGFLKDFEFDNALEYRHSDTEFYRIYYVPADLDSDKTEIPIPYEAFGTGADKWEYDISGNNADGFIVTVKIPELSPDYDDSYLYLFNSNPELADYQSPDEEEYDDSSEYADDTFDSTDSSAETEETEAESSSEGNIPDSEGESGW